MPLRSTVKSASRSSAGSYTPVKDLWVISSFFNPSAYRTKLANYKKFISEIRDSGLNWLVIECAFEGDRFQLPPSPNVIQVQAKHVMWQKERLINLGLQQLPEECAKIAWLDCDILFTNPNWAVQASELLNDYPVVQLFDTVVRLPRGHKSYTGQGDKWEGFGSVYSRQPAELLSGRFDKHGHTGFAWAARRETLGPYGLYDACISGSGDHMMAHAFCGDWDSHCIERIFSGNEKHKAHFVSWCREIYKKVQARVGFVSGAIHHLWHGDIGDRRYVLRNQELALFEFDPAADIRIGSNGCWEWRSKRPDLQAWAVNYYAQRKEDGNGHSSNGGSNKQARKLGELTFTTDQEYIRALEAALGRAHLEIESLRETLRCRQEELTHK